MISVSSLLVPQAEEAGGAAGFGSGVPRSPGAAGRMVERHRETPELGRAHGNANCQDHPTDRQAQGTVCHRCRRDPPPTINVCFSVLRVGPSATVSLFMFQISPNNKQFPSPPTRDR